MHVGSLFSGIGGIELGFEREGFKTKWFVEKEPFCQAVLKKHFKGTPCYGEISEVDFKKLERTDILTGGFPCQDISIAGKGKGIVDGKRSSLWKYFAKAIRILRPKYAVIENVSALTFRGLSNVLADLAKEGYDAEWFDLRARDFGAPHKRERIFIIAYINPEYWYKVFRRKQNYEGRIITNDWSERVQRFKQETFQGKQGFSWCQDVRRVEDFKGRSDIPEPLIRGKSDGVSNRTHRLKSLGNAVVPQVAQFIARRIKEIEQEKR